MNQKYYNDAIIGNKNIKATFNNKGELLRIYYPSVDFAQFIDFFRLGIKVNDSGILYLHDDINNKYKQYYTEDTNILNTEIENTYFNLTIQQTDFALIKENVLIKKIVLKNNNKVDLDIDMIIYSKLLSNINNEVSCKKIDNGLIQYSHDYNFSIFANRSVKGHRINDTEEYIKGAILEDKDYIGMSADSSVSYTVSKIKPEEEAEIIVYILLEGNKEIHSVDETENAIERILKLDINNEYKQTKKYWKRYLEEHNKLDLSEFDKVTLEQIKNIYKRTILLFPLLQNDETGGISAAMEVDEYKTRSGRYSYCWPRDAVFITKAFDELGMEKETEKFYRIFCKNTQSSNGMWEQRFYTDTRLAPCWGYQIDETASVIYGVYEHYKIYKNEKFLNDCIKMCEKAMDFLFRYLAFIFEEKEEEDIVKKEILEETRKLGKERDKIYKHNSYDLWEMNEGIHLYSLACIYSALTAMAEIYERTKEKYKENRLKMEQITKKVNRIEIEINNIREYISKNMYDEKQKILHRNNNDDKMDISIIGAVTPFNLLNQTEKRVLNTVDKINMTLRTYTGGYIRFEDDSYMEGSNPWPIATLWMAQYYIKIGDLKKAKECIDFVTKTSTDLGFLAEQVDNRTMKSNWVIGLGWSHAMYIITLREFIRNEGKK